MNPPERRIERFEDLTLLGKSVFLGGAAARLAANLIDRVIDHTAGIMADAERAFRQGLDPNVEEAKILEEHDERGAG